MELDEEIILKLGQNKALEHIVEGDPDQPEHSWTELRDILALELNEEPNAFGVKLSRALNRLKEGGFIDHPYRGARYRLSDNGYEKFNEIINNSSNGRFRVMVRPLLPEFMQDGKLISYEEFKARYIEVLMKRMDPEIRCFYNIMEEGVKEATASRNK